MSIKMWAAAPVTIKKFSLDAVGTGTGVSRYAHGVYFGQKSTAEHYLEMQRHSGLAQQHFVFNDKTISEGSIAHEVASFLADSKNDIFSAQSHFDGRSSYLNALSMLTNGFDDIAFTSTRGTLHEVEIRGYDSGDFPDWNDEAGEDEIERIGMACLDKIISLDDLDISAFAKVGIEISDYDKASEIIDALFESAMEEIDAVSTFRGELTDLVQACDFDEYESLPVDLDDYSELPELAEDLFSVDDAVLARLVTESLEHVGNKLPESSLKEQLDAFAEDLESRTNELYSESCLDIKEQLVGMNDELQSCWTSLALNDDHSQSNLADDFNKAVNPIYTDLLAKTVGSRLILETGISNGDVYNQVAHAMNPDCMDPEKNVEGQVKASDFLSKKMGIVGYRAPSMYGDDGNEEIVLIDDYVISNNVKVLEATNNMGMSLEH